MFLLIMAVIFVASVVFLFVSKTKRYETFDSKFYDISISLQSFSCVAAWVSGIILAVAFLFIFPYLNSKAEYQCESCKKFFSCKRVDVHDVIKEVGREMYVCDKCWNEKQVK